jgi:predicted TIM-barrel fold metal-dependent hydrolase
MTEDYHLHIGQFCETYYDPLEVLRIVAEAGITDAAYSSTTSAKEGARYQEIEREIAAVTARYPADRYEPLLWYIPPYIDEGVTVENAFQHLPYGGIKLHPRVHHWDLHDTKHRDCLHTLFGYAGDKGLPVLIHTGEDEFERPAFFASFFSEYPQVKFILAHCRPAPDTIALFRAHSNVYGDTAFLDTGRYTQIAGAGFAGRLIPGTDFPITHYFAAHYPQENSAITLAEQYQRDAAQMGKYEKIEAVSKRPEIFPPR